MNFVAIQAALTPVGGMAKLDQGASPLAIGAMNWARWEYQVQCKRRLEIWRMKAANKVPGSRRMIYDTRRPARPLVDFEYNKGSYTHLYGGAISGCMKITATQIMKQQQYFMQQYFMSQIAQKWADEASKLMADQIDAIMLRSLGTKVKIRTRNSHAEQVVRAYLGDEVGWHNWRAVEQPPRYERAGRWQSNLTGSGPSVSVTLSSAPRTSRSDGNKSKHGWLSRMPRKFTK